MKSIDHIMRMAPAIPVLVVDEALCAPNEALIGSGSKAVIFGPGRSRCNPRSGVNVDGAWSSAPAPFSTSARS